MRTLYNVKAQTLLNTLAGTVSKAKNKTLGNTVANVEVKRLVDSVGDTLEKGKDERHQAM